jgi:multiple sugar transport system substrate-binding protein
MKRIVQLMIVAAAIFVLTIPGFTAGKQKIEVWHRWTGVHADIFNEVVKRFEADNPRIDVEVVPTPGEYINLTQKMLARLAAGQTPPDVVFCGYNFLGYMVREFGAVQLEPLKIIYKSRFVDGVLKTGQINGKQYGLPFGISSPVVYVNGDLLAKSGIAESSIKTWTDLDKAARKIAVSQSNKKGLYISNVDTFLLQSMIESAGGCMVKNGKPAFNSAAGVKAVTIWRDLYKDGVIPQINYREAQTAFASGQIGIFITSIMDLQTFATQVNFPLHVLPFPKFGARQPRLASGGAAGLLFSRNSGQKRAAAKFLKYLTTAEAAKKWSESGYLSAIKGVKALNPNQAVAYSQLPYSVAWTSWPGPNCLEIEKQVSNWRDRILYTKMNVKDGLNNAVDAANKLIDQRK